VNSVPSNPNADRLLAAVEKLTPLLDRMVFVGGCATGLLISDPAATPVRPTLDVDVIVEIASYPDLPDWSRNCVVSGYGNHMRKKFPFAVG
jgi:hypothetical protein